MASSERRRKQRTGKTPARPRSWEVRTAPRRRWAPWQCRALAVVLSVAAVGGLLGAVLLVPALPSAVSTARQFLAAPVCTARNAPDCRWRQSELVQRAHISNGRNQQTTVDLLDPGTGDEQRVVPTGVDPLGNRLTGGDRVELISWHGRPTALRAQERQQDASSRPTDGQALT
ncbi:hypothetical protein E6W39_13985 [Kitasatospora acidiphila]|uniref:Uncharacterized protein n=1 Tax=Kitasatospora acidiphila TaxID=2567942 RepID=A0A540W2C4_9ACTN|nr:hypothetical protein [Kitasatospora acidiphila]TQF03153.1 hypothetical protein E6W39_13985 [Kitasatospora acidiphila]